MTVRQLTADEVLYMKEHKSRKLDDKHDFQNDPQFKEWIKKLTNRILDGVFPRETTAENKEAIMYLWKHPTRKLECGKDCLKLFKPLDEKGFEECRKKVPYEQNQEVTEKDEKHNLYCNYYLNNITELKKIFDLIDRIFHDETKPFKIAFDCGFIVEDTVNRTYDLARPRVQNLGKTVPMTIVSPSDVQLYKHLVFSTLGDYTSEVHAVSAGSQFHYCALYAIFFQVTRFGSYGARILVPGYDFLVKNKYIKDYGNENNLCMFYVVANSDKK